MKGTGATGFLVASVSHEDAHHEWAASLAEQFDEPLLTCEAVLAEAAFHIGNVALVLELIRNGLIKLSFDCFDNLTQLEELAQRYADRRPDLADLCVIRMSELYPRPAVITLAPQHFQSYRQNNP